MTTDRPPYLLAFVADNSGCGWHRGVLPLAALTAAGLVEGRVEGQHWRPDMLVAIKPDVIVWQRQVEEHQIEHLRLAREALPDCHMVYEIDDLLSEVPERNFHAGAIPPDIDSQIRRALVYCDAVSTTTPLLAEWMKGLGAKKVHLIQNLMPRDKVRKREVTGRVGKIRVGWGGGMSHAGDLELIKPAMAEIGDAVEWVFLGYQPEGELPVEIEYHEATLPSEYTDALYKLDCDLFLAPLELNRFNEAKSNLRLVEAGACSAAVIAQDVASYRERRPPVFGYCKTAEDWTRTIKRFLAQTPERRRQHGDAMREWVAEHYTFETRLQDRFAAWMPDGAARWAPEPIAIRGDVTVVQDATQLEAACKAAREAGDHVLWARPGVAVTDGLTRHLKAGFIGKEPVAAVMPLSCDGINAVPRQNQFTSMDAGTADALNGAAQEACTGLRLRQPLAFGPCVLLRAEVLVAIGSPDVAAHGHNVDAALMEWTARAAMKRLYCIQMADVFVGSLTGGTQLSETSQMRLRARGYAEMAQMPSEPLSPEHRESIELGFFRRKWNGLRPGLSNFREDYLTWAALKRPFHGKHDPALVQVIPYNKTPDPFIPWTVFCGQYVKLRPGALAQFAAVLRDVAVNTTIVYGDHEILDFDGSRTSYFKPDFDYQYFLARDYVTPVMAVRTMLVPDGCRNEADAFEVVLREAVHARAKVATPMQTAIRHIPEIMADLHDHRPREIRVAANIGAAEARADIIKRAVHGLEGAEAHPQLKTMDIVKAQFRQPDGKVRVIIPTRGEPHVIQPCVNMILQHTQHPNLEVLLVVTADDPAAYVSVADTWMHDRRVRVAYTPMAPFNWSAVNNEAARHTDAEFLLFLNDDTVAANKGWLEAMVSCFTMPDVGVVGGRLLHPAAAAVQSTGIVYRDRLVGQENRGMSARYPGYHGIGAVTHEAVGVSGACLMTRSNLFREIGGFDENLAVNFNDLAYCLRVAEKGYRVVAEMQADLHHREGFTRSRVFTEQQMMELVAREGVYFDQAYRVQDRYWNPNFALRLDQQHNINGVSRDLLAFAPGDPAPDARRVLFINDRVTQSQAGVDSRAIRRQRDSHDIVLAADLSGVDMTLTAPAFASPVQWDIRDHRTIARALRAMGVEEVVLCSMTGGRAPAAAVEALASLRRLGVALRYDPLDAEIVCPRRDLTVDGKDCGSGYRKGVAHCQACIDQHGSPFGQVDVSTWWRAWGAFSDATEGSLADAAD